MQLRRRHSATGGLLQAAEYILGGGNYDYQTSTDTESDQVASRIPSALSSTARVKM